MSRPEDLDDLQNRDTENDKVSDTYTSEVGEDLYHTPDNNNTSYDVIPYNGQQTQDNHSYTDSSYGSCQSQDSNGYNNSPYGNGYYGNQQSQGRNGYSNSPYGNGYYENQQSQGSNGYHNSPYGNGYYGNQQSQGGNGYNSSPYGSGYYGNRQSQGGSGYDSSPYGNGYYENQQSQGSNGYNNSPYGNDYYGNRQSQGRNGYNSSPYGNGYYGNQQSQNSSPYNDSPYNGNSYSNHQGSGMYGSNPYSPYATPAKKNNTRLIIGIVTGIILLFLIAVFALTYKVISLYSEERNKAHDRYEEYDFDAGREKNRDNTDPFVYDYDDYYDDGYYNDHDYNDDYYGGHHYDDHDYDSHYYDDYDYDSDPYYTLHDDIRGDLSYTVDFDYYEYDTDNDNVDIMVSYPVIEGDNVPNLAHLNDVIAEEARLFQDYYEEYKEYLNDEVGYFSALASGYVTYMDEERLSIVFSEYIYADYYNDVYLYCINIDMENGVILNNTNILNADDDFSVEFRKKSDMQNGEILYLTAMTDQEITEYFNSDNIIVFYTPKGMEIGFNYEQGWVTVTYEDYEQYLKVF